MLVCADMFCLLVLSANWIISFLGACGYCCLSMAHIDFLWVLLVECQFKWINCMANSIIKTRMALYIPTWMRIIMFALACNFVQTSAASFWKRCKAVKNTEAVKYSVEGQASHTDERYLLLEMCSSSVNTEIVTPNFTVKAFTKHWIH